MVDFQTVIDFWFGDLDSNGMADNSRSSLWWRSTPEFDEVIRAQFSKLHQEIISGGCTSWLDDAYGALAYILVLDQFSRNLYRGNPQAFSGDAMAVLATKHSINHGYLTELPPIMSVFLLMPLMHSEDLDDQRLSLQYFGNLEAATEGEVKKLVTASAESAKSHAEIVMQFGRYPHRNKALGRETSAEEVIYLESGGQRFGQ